MHPESPIPGTPRRADGPSLIVVGLDGSSTAWHAFAWACGHARRAACPVLAVYVSTLRYWEAPLAGEATAAVLEAEQSTVRALQQEAELLAGAFDVRVSFEHRRGEAARELLTAAREHSADLLAIGSSVQPFHRVAGSLASRLVRCRQVPVVVVP